MINKMVDELKLGKLVMFLLTDGNVSISADRKFEISFVNHNFVLVNEFTRLLSSLFGTHNSHWSILPTGQFRVAIFSKKIVNFLSKFSPSFRKKKCKEFRSCPLLRGKKNFPCIRCNPININGEQFPPVRVPEFIFNLSPKEICEVLRILTSTEGCVTLQVRKNPLKIEREVTIGCRHPMLLMDFNKLFELVGLPFHTRKDRLFISSKISLEKFREKVGFLDSVVVARKNSSWFGIEKNRLLDLALKSFDIKPKKLGLMTREAVFKLLRERLLACH